MSRTTRTCSTCAHDGCCEGLPHCGGTYWDPAFGECAQCGREVLLEDAEFADDDGHVFCSEECMDEWTVDNAEEEEANDGAS